MKEKYLTLIVILTSILFLSACSGSIEVDEVSDEVSNKEKLIEAEIIESGIYGKWDAKVGVAVIIDGQAIPLNVDEDVKVNNSIKNFKGKTAVVKLTEENEYELVEIKGSTF